MIVGALLLLGEIGTAIKGGELALEGVEEVTGIPVLTGVKNVLRLAIADVRGIGGVTELLVEGAGDTIANVLDPLHLFTTNPADERDAAQAGLKQQKKRDKKLRQQLAEAQATATAAEQQAAAAEAAAQAAIAAGNQAKATKASQKARSARRFAAVSRTMQRSAVAAAASPTDQSQDKAYELAVKALEVAKVAIQAPTDSRAVLRSAAPPAVKQIVSDTIDAVNRDEEPDIEYLARRLSGDSYEREGAVADIVNAAEAGDIGGHECHCGGACDPCKQERARRSSSWADWTVQGVEVIDASAHRSSGGELDWDGGPERAIYVDEGGSIAFPLPADSACPTGSCAVNRYKMRG
jgi:hypothetical protein